MENFLKFFNGKIKLKNCKLFVKPNFSKKFFPNFNLNFCLFPLLPSLLPTFSHIPRYPRLDRDLKNGATDRPWWSWRTSARSDPVAARTKLLHFSFAHPVAGICGPTASPQTGPLLPLPLLPPPPLLLPWLSPPPSLPLHRRYQAPLFLRTSRTSQRKAVPAGKGRWKFPLKINI